MINLTEKLRDAGLEPRSYSGRGMYGKQCVGVDGDQRELNRALKSVIDDCLSDAYGRGQDDQVNAENPDNGMVRDDLIESEYPELEDIQKFVGQVLDYRQDQMGLGYIYYWPSIEWTEEEQGK